MDEEIWKGKERIEKERVGQFKSFFTSLIDFTAYCVHF
jgi:hypothetical protein